jgi:hypothetical protein
MSGKMRTYGSPSKAGSLCTDNGLATWMPALNAHKTQLHVHITTLHKCTISLLLSLMGQACTSPVHVSTLMYFDQIWYWRLIPFTDCHSFFALRAVCVVACRHVANDCRWASNIAMLWLWEAYGRCNITELFLGVLELWLMVRMPLDSS